ncbi:hypothetical protein HHK36_014570 [Tetracentron sinense]|uniref:Uncharacterized protein n=1 Tax=Tetracentron sinense TaxID=13715 RepID=A0A835DCT8_TETSI|nr:hypothetical protein HHK36_014570 [Tetracentron sinense]
MMMMMMGGNGKEIVRNAEKLVVSAMKGNDASHDASHVFRVRDLALSLAREEGLSSSSSSEAMEIMVFVNCVELTRDIIIIMTKQSPSSSNSFEVLTVEEDPKLEWQRQFRQILEWFDGKDPSEETIVEKFLEEEGIEESKRMRILKIVKGMGFKEELAGCGNEEYSPEFGVVQDADRLDAIGAIGIARCFTFGGSRSRVLHDPAIQPRSDLSKEQYMKKDKQTTVNHFHEKLLKLKDLMKTKAGQRRAEQRHKFMEEFLKEFYEEWDGRA